MYTICNTPRTMKVQHEYIKHLYYLLEEKPYSEISIQDICNSVNGSRRSFYRYFRNKEGCLHALLDMIITRFYYTEMPRELAKEGYPTEILSYLHYHQQRKDLYDILLKNDLFSIYVDRIVECARKNGVYSLRWFGIQDGPYSNDALVFYVHGSMALIKRWHCSGYQRSIYEMADMLSQLISGEWKVSEKENN